MRSGKGIRMTFSRRPRLYILYNPPILPLSCCFSARGRNLLYSLVSSSFLSIVSLSPLQSVAFRACPFCGNAISLRPSSERDGNEGYEEREGGERKRKGGRVGSCATGVDKIQVLLG